MKGTVKIVTIGGGSSYTPELMEGFIKRYEELPIKEIWLVDIEDGKEGGVCGHEKTGKNCNNWWRQQLHAGADRGVHQAL